MIRRGSGIADNVIKAGDLTMDIASHTVFRGEEALTLTAKVGFSRGTSFPIIYGTMIMTEHPM